MTSDSHIREEIVLVARSLYQRGYSHGSTGNISVALDDGIIVTPTGSSFGALDPARLSKLDFDGNHLSGDAPTKENFLHQAVFDARDSARAVIHLHGANSVALSCLPADDPDDVLPKLTPYGHMLCGHVALIPYYRPGDIALAEAIRLKAKTHWSILLAHHGPVVAGKSLRSAMHATEELEQTARLALLLRNANPTELNAEQIADLTQHFPQW